MLDANVVIHLHELGLWGMIIERFEVFLASTVCDEAMFWTDADGQEHPIALKQGTFEEITASPSALADLKRQFPGFQLDAGELESLAWLLSGKADDECQICSSDAVVFKVLGAKAESFRGTSLEELLKAVGDSRKLSYQYTKAFRERYTAEGFGCSR